VKSLFQFTIGIVLFGFVILPTQATFTSLYVFGDALSTTTNNPSASSFPTDYYGKRYCNGRVWVEVLAQRQGAAIGNNWSYFDCNSSNLVTNVKNFNISSSLASNALFVVWVNNSDLYDKLFNATTTNQTEWTAMINRGQTNHFSAITNLYAKGARTLVMPNVVDIGKVPYFLLFINNFSSITNFVRQECIAYDVAFSNTLNQARAACPGLTIYQPNFFGLLDNVLANAASYGLTNALTNGVSIDAMDALYPKCSTNGLGTNYVFWDDLDPSAQFHEVMADVVQQVVSPVQISQLTVLNGSNRLDMANIPIGLNGFVDGSTNLALANWTSVTNFNSITTMQSVFVIAPPLPSPVAASGGSGGSGSIDPNNPSKNPSNQNGTYVPPFSPSEFYRLRFPYVWTWP
jgi:phospholipase/lecithinase/hemolysin